MSEEENLIFARFGLSEDQKHGQGWREAFPRLSWDTVSVASTSGISGQYSDQADSGTGTGTGDTTSLDSIRPDYPVEFQLEEAESAELENISLCWVDGGCLSFLK